MNQSCLRTEGERREGKGRGRGDSVIGLEVLVGCMPLLSSQRWVDLGRGRK